MSELAQAVLVQLREAEPARLAEAVVTPYLTCTGDPSLLRILLENVLSNAWKFTSKKPGARIEFGRASACPPGQPALEAFLVHDNGAGFDMRYADELFSPFERFHSAEEFPGTGIGLATVQRIVSRHGGTVWAESAVGQGTTIRFSLGTDHRADEEVAGSPEGPQSG